MATATARKPKTEEKAKPFPAGSITLDRRELLAGLNVVSRVTPTRATLPICSYAVLRSAGGRVTLNATDLEVHISWLVCPAPKGQRPFAVVIPVRRWVQHLSAMDADEVTVTFGADRSLKLEGGNVSFSEGQFDYASEFPKLEEFEPSATATLPGKDFKAAAQRTWFAAAHDDSRHILTSVYLTEYQGSPAFVSADGFRMNIATVPLEGELRDVCIPSSTLRLLANLVGDDLVALQLNEARTRLNFVVGARLFVQGLLVVGSFPNFSHLIPGSFEHAFTLPAATLQRAVRLVSSVALEGSVIVRLMASPEGLKVYSYAAGGPLDEQALVRLLCPVEGEKGKTALNWRYISDAAGAVKGDIRFEWESPSRQVVIRNVSDPGHLQVVMPMFVQWGD